MQITETERLMLVKDKETICGATLQILRVINDPKNTLLVKENMTTILQLISTIASYSDSKNADLSKITDSTNWIFSVLTQYNEHPEIFNETIPNYWNRVIIPKIETYCNVVNSITFNFNGKEGIKITLPKINLNFGHINNQ